MVGSGRLELPTSCVSSRRSNQLSYDPLTAGLSVSVAHGPILISGPATGDLWSGLWRSAVLRWPGDVAIVCCDMTLLRPLPLLAFSILAACSTSTSPRPEPTTPVIDMERVLLDNIASFWYPRSIDEEHGGYRLHFNANGEPGDDHRRMIVTQARMVWFFSNLAREGYSKDGAFRESDLLSAAGHGYTYLRDRMWDNQHGGFFWMLDESGQTTAPNKHLYGQAFALYALSEYYLASGNQEALDLAIRLFELLEEYAHDREYGGYREYFAPNWSEVPPGTQNYLGDRLDVKLMNTHLHLLEAMTTFYRASGLPAARERLIELIDVATDKVVVHEIGACTDVYERDWTPIRTGPLARVSYGHDLENVWIAAQACEAAGVDVRQFLPLFRRLWAFSLENGYDRDSGGFFESGPLDGPANNREKTWWVQAEALVSALYMLKLTGESRYRDVFDQTWQFVFNHQIDWANGEWHQTVLPSGEVRGVKGGIWKSAYHNGRAMIECLRLLKEEDFSGGE